MVDAPDPLAPDYLNDLFGIAHREAEELEELVEEMEVEAVKSRVGLDY